MRITRGAQYADVTTDGGRVLSYVVHGKEVLAAAEPVGRQIYRSALLAPWPNRVADGRWEWEGEPLQLPINEPELGTALHGLVADVPFRVRTQASEAIVLEHSLGPSPGYPFSLLVSAGYALTDGGLECFLEARNTSRGRVPVALGVHPYLDCRGVVDDTVLTVPAHLHVEGDRQWQELERTPVSGTSRDLRAGRHVGSAAIDACWTDLDRSPDGRVTCRLALPDGDSVAVWGGASCRYVVVYNSATLPGELHRRSIAVEPNTAGANVLRSGTDLDVLEPGHSLRLDWGLIPSWL